MRLKTLAGWNQTEADWRALLDLSGSGSFGARVDNLLVGSALVLEYESDPDPDGRIGWVSMILVDPSFRRRGIGTQLLEAAITGSTHLRVHLLDATQAGVPVYERLGFSPVDAITRWRLKASDRTDSTNFERADIHARSTSDASTESLIAMDRSATGFSRPRLVKELLRRWNPISTPGGGIALGRDGSGAHQIGPVISSSPEEAKDLINRAVISTGGELIVDLLDRHLALADFVGSLGFSRERSFSRMVRSDSHSIPVSDKSLIAIAGPEFG